MTRLMIVTLALVASTGCATLAPRAHADGFAVKHFGEAQDARERSKAFKSSMKTTLEDLQPEQVGELVREVKVLENTLPPGVTVSEGVIAATPESGYEVVGTFKFAPQVATSAWFHDYNSVGKKVWCYWQVPLTWATVLMWQIFVPLSWPCVAASGIPIDEGYGYLRQAAKSAGADLVILTGTNKTDEKFFGADGIFLRERGRSPEPAPSDTRREL